MDRGHHRAAPRTAVAGGQHLAVVVLALAVCAAGTAPLAGCGRGDEAAPRPLIRNLPSQEVRNFTLKETDTGRPDWILTSRYAASYSQNGVIRAQGVAIDFFDNQGKIYSHLTAREGSVQQPANDMEATGD